MDAGDVADLIVVGAGAAGFSAAITAATLGARVLLIETAVEPGGTTAKSGGSIWIPNNKYMRQSGQQDSRMKCLAYLARLSYPHMFDPNHPSFGLDSLDFDLLSVLYDRGADAIEVMERAGAVYFSERLTPQGEPIGLYPDYHDDLKENGGVVGRTLTAGLPDDMEMPEVENKSGYIVGVGGSMLVATMRRAAENLGVGLLLGHRVRELLTDSSGTINGVYADSATGEAAFQARSGVVFTTGGFLMNPSFRRQYLRGPVYGGSAASTTVGDFLPIAARVGAALGNMTHASWNQMALELALDGGPTTEDVWYSFGDSVIQVDKYGNRVLNEKQPYNERGQIHFHWNPNRREYSNLVLFQIYDDHVAQNPLRWPYRNVTPMPHEDVDYVVSADSIEELAAGLDQRLQRYARHVGSARLAPDFASRLRQSIARFNEHARRGLDADFQRGETSIQRHVQGPSRGAHPNPTMAPLASHGPYHAIILVAGAIDTRGGPRIDSGARVLSVTGDPIPGLYGAGSCISSPLGQAYPGAGAPLGSAITFGFVAGSTAMADSVGRSGDAGH